VLRSKPAPAATGHNSTMLGAATVHRAGDAVIAMLFHQEDSGTSMYVPSRPEATTSRTRRGHPWGLAGPSRISSRQGMALGCPRGRSSPTMTAQSGGEATSSVCGPGTMIAPAQASARGLTAPRAATLPRTDAQGLNAPRVMTTRSATASDTSVSNVISGSSRSTQTHPLTRIGAPLAP
jgi:hypothetical protein